MVRQLAAVARLILAALLIVSLSARPAAAQSILRATETEAFFDDMARPLVVAAGLDPPSVRVVLVGVPSITVFFLQRQAVYHPSAPTPSRDNLPPVPVVVAHSPRPIPPRSPARFSEDLWHAHRNSIYSL